MHGFLNETLGVLHFSIHDVPPQVFYRALFAAYFTLSTSQRSNFVLLTPGDYLFDDIVCYLQAIRKPIAKRNFGALSSAAPTGDKISKQNTYKDFSNSLEHINSVLKTWNNDSEWEKMNMVIGVLNENEFLFSNIWKTSCYLVKKQNVIEITDKKDKKKEFSFISNGDLEHNDIIVLGTWDGSTPYSRHPPTPSATPENNIKDI